MPYIKRDRRPFVLRDGPNNAGELNFLICSKARELGQKLGGDYSAHNAIYGAMLAAAAEYYRRVVAPYEDTKIKENGDVF